MVKISVIIPIYNVEKYLEECLDSIINQTLKDIEIICINDGSSDNSLAILESYAKKDNRIKIFNQKNSGQGIARNKGIDYSKGEFIYFVDADDYIKLNMFEELYKNATSNNSDIVISKIARFNDGSNEIDYNHPGFDFENEFENVDFNSFSFNYRDIKKYVLNASFAPWMKLFKSDFLRNNDLYFAENIAFEDVPFHVKSLIKAQRISFSPNFYYYYRNNPKSTMNTSEKGFDIFKVINIVEKFLITEGYGDYFKDELDLFKITQVNNYIFTTKSDDYIKKAKDVFVNMNINEDNPLLSKPLIDNCCLLLESDSLNDYVNKLYSKLSLELDNKINSIADSSKLQDNINQINNTYNKIEALLSNNILAIDKLILTDYIKSYKKLYYLLINSKFKKFPLSKLDLWTEKLIDSDLSIQEKVDLLHFASFLFNRYYDGKLYKSDQFKTFAKYIKKGKYIEAIGQYSKLYDDNAEIKDNHIYILFWGLEEEIGGVAKAVSDRANLLYGAGYQVTLLNNNAYKNSTFIIDKYHELGYLNDSIDIINIYDYYCEKNTFNLEYEKTDLSKDFSDKNINKITNEDNSITLQYFDCDDKLVKEELYLSDYLSVEKNYDNGRLINEYYFTCDSFNYLYRDYKTGDFILFDRACDCYISFKNLQEFEDYFVTEICLKSNVKPFLINDCSGPTPSIKKISSDVAYKIGVVHNNPYLEPYCFGSPMRNIASLSDYKNEDAVVLLTESAKNDFTKQFDYDNFIVIPNFIPDEDIEKSKKEYVKENNVISIFARIAREKNIPDLIKAFKKVLEKHDDAILKIYGRALLPNEIKEKKLVIDLIEELSISNSVKFMGHVNNVFEEMSKSLATVLCSNIEGFGLVIIESMLNSTPVVSYDVNYGPRDLIVNDLNGYVVPQYDIDELSQAIIKILDDPDSACKMGLLAREHVLDNFTSNVVLEKWEKLFNDVYLNK